MGGAQRKKGAGQKGLLSRLKVGHQPVRRMRAQNNFFIAAKIRPGPKMLRMPVVDQLKAEKNVRLFQKPNNK